MSNKKNDKRNRKNSGSRKGGSGYNPNSKEGTKTCDPATEDNQYGTGGHNDVAWYVPNEQVLRDAASFSFANFLGGGVTVGGNNGSNSNMYTLRFPGITRIEYVPTYGDSTDSTSALNIASRNIYSFVRHANSGHSNYDAPDLMMYLCAMDNLYTFYFNCVRAYGCARYYQYKNKYLARTLIHALGFDYDFVITHMADFRVFINTMALRLNVLAVPKSMTLFQRHAFMCSNVYADSMNSKAQLYVFVPAGYGWLDEFDEATGVWGKVKYTYRASGDMEHPQSYDFVEYVSLADLEQVFAKMADAIIGSEDFNIMSGDILKAYGAENCVQLPLISEDYTQVPVYQPEVLPQIMNARAFGPVFNSAQDGTPNGNGDDKTITLLDQDPGILQGGLIYTVDTAFHNGVLPTNYNGDHFVFNLHSEVPTPAEVMVASRLTVGIGISSTNAVHLTTFGTEIPIRFTIFTRPMKYGAEQTGTFSVSTLSYIMSDLSKVDTTANVYNYFVDVMNVLSKASCFDWFPIITWFRGTVITDTAKDLKPRNIFGDLDNFTIMTTSDIKKMHDVALIQELGIPYNGVARR